MSEKETKTPVAETVEEKVVETKVKKASLKGYVISGLVVILIILGVLFLLEKEGRSSTNIFDSIIASQQANTVVAIVNGEKITSSELDVSVQQFTQLAASQGVDTESVEARLQVRGQALDVLVNTKLLRQIAEEKGIEITNDLVLERMEVIKSDIGGEEVLFERMAELGIEEGQLQKDIYNELIIQKVLDGVFAEADITFTEEEVVSLYEGAGGEESGLPALEEVRSEIEAQIKATKEQEVIDEYLAEIKEEAEIELI